MTGKQLTTRLRRQVELRFVARAMTDRLMRGPYSLCCREGAELTARRDALVNKLRGGVR